ncbi:hypothetical protein, partial [Flavobacterium branchiophilum]
CLIGITYIDHKKLYFLSRSIEGALFFFSILLAILSKSPDTVNVFFTVYLCVPSFIPFANFSFHFFKSSSAFGFSFIFTNV